MGTIVARQMNGSFFTMGGTGTLPAINAWLNW